MNCLLAVLVTASLTVAAEPKADFAFREISPAGLATHRRRQAGFRLQLRHDHFESQRRRAAVVLPASRSTPPNGVLLSDDFNPDHPHHRGISWMWPDVTVDGHTGDIWMVKGFQTELRPLESAAKPTARPPSWPSKTAGSTAIRSSSRKTWRSSFTAWKSLRPAMHNGSSTSRSASRRSTSRCGSSARLRARRVSAASASALRPRRRRGQDGHPHRQRHLRTRTKCSASTLGPKSPARSTASPPGDASTISKAIRAFPKRLALAARLRLFERLLSGPHADHSGARQAAGAEVSRHSRHWESASKLTTLYTTSTSFPGCSSERSMVK